MKCPHCLYKFAGKVNATIRQRHIDFCATASRQERRERRAKLEEADSAVEAARWHARAKAIGIRVCSCCALLLVLVSCQTPVELAASGGPSGSVKIGKRDGASPGIFGALFGTKANESQKPPPGVVIIAAGDGMAVNAQVQTAQPIQSNQSSYQNQTPPGVLDQLAKWFLKPDDPPPPSDKPPTK